MISPFNIVNAADDDMYIILRTETSSDRTEISIANGNDPDFGEWQVGGKFTKTALHQTPGLWHLVRGYNFYDDQLPVRHYHNHPHDIYAILNFGTQSGQTEVHVLDGVHRFDNIRRSIPTALAEQGWDSVYWRYEAGGSVSNEWLYDIYAIKTGRTQSGMTEVHVLDGSDDYQSFKLRTPTALHQLDRHHTWHFEVGRWGADDRDDGIVDLWAIKTGNTDSGMIEVFILDGATNFTTFRKILVTDIPVMRAPLHRWVELGDYDYDGITDLYIIDGRLTGNIEVLALPGAHEFRLHYRIETGYDVNQSEYGESPPRMEIFMTPHRER
jgi:hypothetical protein